MPGNTELKPGEVGNPNGRPIGSRNKRTTEIVNQIIATGNRDPLLTLSDLQQNSQDEGIRASAANMLAPYLHSKLGATPAPPPKIYLETQILLPCPYGQKTETAGEPVAHTDLLQCEFSSH